MEEVDNRGEGVLKWKGNIWGIVTERKQSQSWRDEDEAAETGHNDRR